MDSRLESPEPAFLDTALKIPYKWAVGRTATHFFQALRDEQQILGTRCDGCAQVLVPPRQTCPRCDQRTGEWVAVGPRGTLTSYTVVHYAEPSLHPHPAPVIYGLIQLDGAGTALLHLLGEVEPAALRAGLRLEPRFADQRTGAITDIAYFRPAE